MNSLKEEIFAKYTEVDAVGHIPMSCLTVCREKKVLNLHIEKTAGTSTYRLMEKNGLDDGVLSNVRLPYEERTEYFRTVVEDWEEYYKFTTVRNKYDQLISLYEMDLRVTGRMALPPGTTFEGFIKNHVARHNRGGIDKALYGWPPDQYFLTHANDQLIFDFIIKFDDYETGLAEACTKMGIECTPFRANVGDYDRSKRRDSYYTPELKELVRTRFAAEFDYFKWTP